MQYVSNEVREVADQLGASVSISGEALVVSFDGVECKCLVEQLWNSTKGEISKTTIASRLRLLANEHESLTIFATELRVGSQAIELIEATEGVGFVQTEYLKASVADCRFPYPGPCRKVNLDVRGYFETCFRSVLDREIQACSEWHLK